MIKSTMSKCFAVVSLPVLAACSAGPEPATAEGTSPVTTASQALTPQAPTAQTTTRPAFTDPKIAGIVQALLQYSIDTEAFAALTSTTAPVQSLASRVRGDASDALAAFTQVCTDESISPRATEESTLFPAFESVARLGLGQLTGAAFDDGYLASDALWHSGMAGVYDNLLLAFAQDPLVKDDLRVLKDQVLTNLALTQDAEQMVDPSDVPRGDGAIAAIVIAINNAEIQWSTYAGMTACSTPAVDLAAKMVLDHTQALDQLTQDLGAQAIPAVATGASAMLVPAQVAFQQWAATQSGLDFDRTYVASEVLGHAKVLGIIDYLIANQVTNATVKADITAARAMVVEHLQLAIDTERELRWASCSAGGGQSSGGVITPIGGQGGGQSSGGVVLSGGGGLGSQPSGGIQ